MWTDLIPIAGLKIGFILFYRYPILSGENIQAEPEKVSVIIPVRNEEENLVLLLEDLKNQDLPLFEVICVDDHSEDGTAEVAAVRKMQDFMEENLHNQVSLSQLAKAAGYSQWHCSRVFKQGGNRQNAF